MYVDILITGSLKFEYVLHDDIVTFYNWGTSEFYAVRRTHTKLLISHVHCFYTILTCEKTSTTVAHDHW